MKMNKRTMSMKHKRMFENACADFYMEEDSNGNYGEVGQLKSYDIGYYTVDNIQADAEENGMSVEEYIVYWFNETYPHEFTWEDIRGGYGFNGDTIATEGNIVFKDIYGQLMIDEYPPKGCNESLANTRNKKALYESIMRKVKGVVKSALNEEAEYGIGSIHDIILYWENDYELYKQVESLMSSLVRKERSGKKKNPDFELSEDILLNSSTLKQMSRDLLKKYQKVCGEPINPTMDFKNKLRQAMVDEIFYRLDDWRDEM